MRVRRQIWPRQRKRTSTVKLRNVVSVTGSRSVLTSRPGLEATVIRRKQIAKRHVGDV